MPGSPAISVTDPGTMPPPSTRSNSENPVAILEMFSVPMSVIGLAADDATGCDCVREVRPGAAVREPLRAAPAAFGTEELRGRLCHIADNTEVLGQDVRGWRTRCTDIALKIVSGTGFHDFEGMVARLMAVKE